MSHTTIRCFLALLGAALTITVAPVRAQLPAWEQQLYEAAKKEKQFTVYTSHYFTSAIADLCTAFDKKYPGVKCNFVRTTGQAAYQRLQQDLQANLAVASVFSSTDVNYYLELKKRGQLMKYQPHNLANMVDSLKQYNDAENYYWVTSAALVAIAYNHSVVAEKDAPKNWPDLLDPKWKNKVSIGHPGYSGYTATWAVLMRKLYGWEYFEKLEKGKPQIGRSINDIVTMLNAKERWVGATADATALESRDKGNPLSVIYPTDGSLLMAPPTGIPRNAPAPNAGKLFVEFLLDKEAAEVGVKNHIMPVIKGIKPAAGSKPLEQIKVVRPTEEEVRKGIPEVKEKFRSLFGV
jgi:iron(III) transport system substrate-binding protein